MQHLVASPQLRGRTYKLNSMTTLRTGTQTLRVGEEGEEGEGGKKGRREEGKEGKSGGGELGKGGKREGK